MPRSARHVPAFLALALAVSASAVVLGTSTASSAAPPDSAGPPQSSPATHHDVSRPLREVPSTPWTNALLVREHAAISPAGATTPRPDGALQGSSSPTTAASTGVTGFAGVGNGDYGFGVTSAPPDTTAAVGDTQYVQWVNTSLAVFDKATGAIAAGFPKRGNTLWSGFGGGCQANNDGDPIVQYDKAANRWVLTQFSVTSPGTYGYLQCVAVSTTSDATGTYNRYAFKYGASEFNDYPKLGIWPDGYYISYNIFTNGSAFAGSKVCSLDRAAMLAGAAATQNCFQLSPSYGGLLPSDVDGATSPAAGAPNAFASFGANSLNVWQFHTDFATPANSTFTGPIAVPVAAFSEACSGGTCIPQAGTNQRLDTLSDRLMYRLAYRNFGDHEAWVVTHSVTAGTSVGVRWYELRGLTTAIPSVYQQSTYAPTADYRWMGSAAMDRMGDIAVGYSVSSGTRYPSIAVSTRAPTDPLGTIGGETFVKNGAGSQTATLSRWGDYSSLTVDPVDDCTFWYSTEYLKASGTFNWSTWITHFTVPGCSAPPPTTAPAAPTGLTATAGDARVSLSWTASTGSPASYTVNRRTASTPYAVVQAGVAGTSVTDSTVTNGTTYYYTVTAVNAAGASPDSNEASATPNPPPPTAAFTKSCSGATCTFDASASTGLTTYAWNFGDNLTGSGVVASHTYTTASQPAYTVTLTGSPAGSASSATATVTCTKKRNGRIACT